jgi:hypothetical protein
MRWAALVGVCFFFGAAAGGCATTEQEVIVANAARDLSCPRAQIQIERQGKLWGLPRYFLAIGCERYIGYVCVSARGDTTCAPDNPDEPRDVEKPATFGNGED